MSRFNTVKSNKVINEAGGEAFKMSPELELTTIALTTFLKDEFYRKTDKTIDRIKELTKKVNPYFVSRLALYARHEFGMRSISHLLAGEVTKNGQTALFTDFIFNVCRRVDDMTEIVSYWLATYGKPVPKRLRKGIRKAFYKFNDYQLAKYRAERSEVKLIDLVNLCHPKPATKNKEALSLLVKNKLVSTETWESMLTQAGQNATDESEKLQLKKEVWHKLLLENKLPYFALLRNLRNIIEQAPEYIDLAVNKLTDEKAIRNSLVLPFRFYTAYIEISAIPEGRKVVEGLVKACEIALKNVPRFEGKTCIALDVSGSMAAHREKACMFAFSLYKANPDADLVLFETKAQYVTVDSTVPILPGVRYMDFPGGGTDVNDVFRKLNKAYDKVIILTDEQSWVSYHTPMKEFNEYRKKYNCNPKVFHWDFAGLGTLTMPEKDIYCLAGFSEKCFDVIKALEIDQAALLKMINDYVPKVWERGEKD